MITVVRDVRETIQERIQNDAKFATALLDEAITLFLNDESETARLILRDLVRPPKLVKPWRYFGNGRCNPM